MPKRYEAIKRSYRKSHPKAGAKAVKSHAARIFNATRKPGTKPVTRRTK
jgi:hypothetical protein